MIMSRLIDITGNKYNKLTVVKRVNKPNEKSVIWECLCDCGNTTYVRGKNLKNGAVKSCGCLLKSNKSSIRHNMSKTRLYRTWANIKGRCYIPSCKAYKNYGLRGITMCDEWKNSFESFMEWALNNGYNDTLSIERIDVNKGYYPDNCTWIPLNEQQKNRTINLNINYNGETKILAEWCRELGKPYKQIHNRIYKLGWSFERAITEPVHTEKRKNQNG